jgi:hypothetical protein
MAITYKLIESKTVGTAVGSVEFTSIPATYTDLLFLISSQSALAESDRGLYILNFNGSTADFSSMYAQGAGSGTPASGSLAKYIGPTPAANTTNVFGNQQLYIPNYTLSRGKSYSVDSVSEANTTLSYIVNNAGYWNNTAAVTSVAFAYDSGNINVHSTFYLYGIKNS